jgi:hypothetical protein
MDNQQNDEIWRWLESDDVTEIIRTINDDLEIYGNDRDIIPSLIGEIADNSLKIDDLRQELQINFGKIDATKLDNAAATIKNKVFSHINELSNKPHTETKRAEPATIPTPVNSINNPPAPVSEAPNPSPTESPAPFILHRNEQEDLAPRAQEVISYGSPIRPIFYNAPNPSPTEEADSTPNRPVKARLELGVQEEAKTNKTQSSKTRPQEERRVNYSEFTTKLDDPFSAHIKTKDKGTSDETKTKKEEVGLKDLPV